MCLCACTLSNYICFVLNRRWDRLMSWSGLRELLRVPARFFVNKPGVSGPHEHVQVSKHHRKVEAPEVGKLCDRASDVVAFAQSQSVVDAG